MPNRHDQHERQQSLGSLGWLIALLLLLLTLSANAVQVQDITRLKGSETSKIVGMGLVVGLPGTGDGGKYLPAMRPLAVMINKLIDPNASPVELGDGKSIALVSLSAEIPAQGVREGDRIDVHVSTVGPCKSLKGGRLFLVPMIGPRKDSPVYAYAEGAITIEDDETPTVGIVPDGGQLTRDVVSQFMDRFGRIQLVINEDNASWPVANNLAGLINGLISPDGPDLAKAVDQKNVIIDVPMYERENPASFISQIMQTYIDPSQVSTGAKVVINEKTGTIIVSGDVQISPVIISHKGLTITTIVPTPEPTADQPMQVNAQFLAMDPEKRGGAKLADLLAAFNQLKVPSDDRIEIIKAIDKSGKLHAKLIYK